MKQKLTPFENAARITGILLVAVIGITCVVCVVIGITNLVEQILR